MSSQQSSTDVGRATSALWSIDPGCERDYWWRIVAAAKAAGVPEDIVLDWSSGAANFDKSGFTSTFRSLKSDGGIGAGSLFHEARNAGWNECTERPRSTPKPPPVDPEQPQAISPDPARIFHACELAPIDQGYIDRKRGLPDGVRVYRGDLKIAGHRVDGWLAIPIMTLAGEIGQIQFIGPDKKLFLPGPLPKDGHFVVGGSLDKGGTTYFVEGIGQAWAAHQSSRKSAVVTFGAGRMAGVAQAVCGRHSNIGAVIVPDKGKEDQAAAIAAAVGGKFVDLPAGWVRNFDVNDLFLESGPQAVAALLASARSPAKAEPKVDIVFASDLPTAFTPPDEIVEGVLTRGAGSVVFGASNSGKTFVVVDLACAVARGVPWMGRRTEPGLVIYLAAESPASVRARLQAYQLHHGVRVPNFAVVQSPIDLFDGDADTNELIEAIKEIEAKRFQPAVLVVGDTLARLSAGANENAGQDMGLVVRRFDRIRVECKAHFLLVHHSGKNIDAGSRGWSGIRAAIDTEIEISDAPTGRCLEITKQRDLSTKGERIGFRLDPVTLGTSKWGKPATTCVVAPTDAPVKTTGKRVSEVGGAIVEFLTARGQGIKKRELVAHFGDRYTPSAIYRELKRLVGIGHVLECAGIVSLAGEVRNGAN